MARPRYNNNAPGGPMAAGPIQLNPVLPNMNSIMQLVSVLSRNNTRKGKANYSGKLNSGKTVFPKGTQPMNTQWSALNFNVKSQLSNAAMVSWVGRSTLLMMR